MDWDSFPLTRTPQVSSIRPLYPSSRLQTNAPLNTRLAPRDRVRIALSSDTTSLSPDRRREANLLCLSTSLRALIQTQNRSRPVHGASGHRAKDMVPVQAPSATPSLEASPWHRRLGLSAGGVAGPTNSHADVPRATHH